MKKALLLLSFSLCLTATFAQKKGNDYVTMKKDGKMYWMRGGQTIRMGIYVPLKNGSFVYPNGRMVKDGDTTQLMRGDKVWMDGTLARSKNQN